MVLEVTTDPTDQGEIPTVTRPRQAEIQFPIIFPQTTPPPEPSSSRRIFGLGPTAAANRTCMSRIHPAQHYKGGHHTAVAAGHLSPFPKGAEQPILLRTTQHTHQCWCHYLTHIIHPPAQLMAAPGTGPQLSLLQGRAGCELLSSSISFSRPQNWPGIFTVIDRSKCKSKWAHRDLECASLEMQITKIFHQLISQ